MPKNNFHAVIFYIPFLSLKNTSKNITKQQEDNSYIPYKILKIDTDIRHVECIVQFLPFSPFPITTARNIPCIQLDP